MEIEKLTIEDVLGMAVRTEIQGRKFYLELSEKVTNPEVKKKIVSLADDEKRHERIVCDFYRRILEKEPQDLPEKGVPDIVKAISSMNLTERTDLLKLLDMAIEAELLSAKFYARGARITEDSKTRRAFEELAVEEDGHYNMLMAEKSALSGDLYWFSMGDTGIMEE
ncbi:MAG: ferritin family protein [Candidatus Zixiibacteriota bacterium]|nr:MAG: ferritin family protein [candidate division Zixibacteria bacterium]